MKKSAWSAYAFMVLVAGASAGIGDGISGMDFVSAAWSALGAVGVLGHAWSRRIGWRFLWKSYLALCVLALSVFVVLMAWGAVRSGDMELVLWLLAAVALQAPLLYALWAYTYRARELWARSV